MCRLKWARHVERMGDEKRADAQKVEGERRRRRPRMRWEDGVKRDREPKGRRSWTPLIEKAVRESEEGREGEEKMTVTTASLTPDDRYNKRRTTTCWCQVSFATLWNATTVLLVAQQRSQFTAYEKKHVTKSDGGHWLGNKRTIACICDLSYYSTQSLAKRVLLRDFITTVIRKKKYRNEWNWY